MDERDMPEMEPVVEQAIRIMCVAGLLWTLGFCYAFSLFPDMRWR